MHQFLIDTISQIINLDSDHIEFICATFKEKKIKKGAYFLKEGELNLHLGFIVQGLVRYTIKKNEEEETTIDFSKEGEFVAVYESFILKNNSMQSIQALEDTTILIITNEELQNFYENIPGGNKLGRVVIEKRFIELAKQLLSIYLHNSEQRYIHFVNKYPDLLQRIPQFYISSFVGVKPQSLSRIRKRLSKG
jgi:CRP-like cAMP-binding protein